MRVIHWFRNDLRVSDNVGLAESARRASRLICLFVLDGALLRGSVQSPARVRFMLDCVERLRRELRERGSELVVRRGRPELEVAQLAEQIRADEVGWNRDYTPYAKRRDAEVRVALERLGIRSVTYKDRVVWEGQEIRTGAGRPFSVYSPYRRAWWRRFEEQPPPMAGPIRLPPSIRALPAGKIASTEELGLQEGPAKLPTGGEKAARRRLRTFLASQVERYAQDRDFPALDGTSRLSAHLRFGTISARTCFEEGQGIALASGAAAPGARKWMDELVWREFYCAILDQHPHVLRGSFRPEYDRMRWNVDERAFEAWCAGMTGYPFVDAGMRQLQQTGWMHNRARMVVASFLTKDLLIDWRWGERYFMGKLVDGDPANNNGGWQWAASTGTDAQPYFRIFNPVTQGERFDADGDYVRRWIPELRALSGRSVHRPWELPLQAPGYPSPIVDHAERRRIALERYEAARRGA